MVKTKKKNIHLPLVITGHVLFVLLILATLTSVVYPWGQILINNYMRVSPYNLTIFFVALTLGAFLPILVGYLIGDRSVKSKSKLNHHFNGVLFGLLAFWLMTILTVAITMPNEALQMNPNVRVLVVNLVPSFVVAIITALLALAHVRSRQAKQDVVSYKPYSLFLIVLIIALPVWSIVNNIATNSVSFDSFIALITTVVVGGVSFVSLRSTKLSTYDRAAWSAISVSVFFVASFVASQLIFGFLIDLIFQPNFETFEALRRVSILVALIGWGVYWVCQAKALRDVKK